MSAVPDAPQMPGSSPHPAPRYRVVVAYDGTAFHGWQKQKYPDRPPVRTVAGVLEDALRRVLRAPLDLVGSSRTDAGVHATGQVAHFDAHLPMPVDRLPPAVNCRLPDDLELVSAEPAPPGFDAITGALSKQYRYRIHNSVRRPLLARHQVWHCWLRLDLAAMQDAARHLVGRHDFAGFAAAGHRRLSTVRTVHDCQVQCETPQVHVVVSGNGFLYNMVRIIAGTLVEVGRGRWGPEAIERVLSTGDRALAGPTLPARGLCLEWIRYAEAGDPAAAPR